MKFKRISTQMLTWILPVVVIAMVILTMISASSCKTIVNNQIQQTLDATLDAQMAYIEEELNVVKNTAIPIADSVGATYKSTSMEEYEVMLSNIIQENDIVLGSGLWFEPYAYDEKEEYMGPYVMKDGGKVVTTYDYSNAEYDYFSQEYYQISKSSKEPVITDPYYDATSGLIMSTCTMPMFDGDKFLGCVTVDIELSSIQEIISNISIGKTGSAMLTTAEGTYMGGVSDELLQQAATIQNDSNTSLAKAGANIIANKEGIETYQNGKNTYNLYFEAIPSTGWIVIIQMSQSELFQPVRNLVMKLIIVAIIAAILIAIIVLYQVLSISGNINNVQKFASALSDGDFTVQSLKVNSKNELGRMGTALNTMYESNRAVIKSISEHAGNMNFSSEALNESAGVLTNKFTEIRTEMMQINDAMTSTSAATEEVNASVEEVNASVTMLATETNQSMDMADSIQKRASEVEESSRVSSRQAKELAAEFEVQLKSSIENSKIVESIGELADSIAGIAEQINLLSLNASIEAARAGEQGRGFAVVAEQIGKLAGETSDTVGEIQNTISDVQEAFRLLTEDAHSMLDFVQNKVNSDYDVLVDTAEQYGKDAGFFADSSRKISEMSENIHHIMNEVTMAVQSIAESSVETTTVSGAVNEAVEEVSTSVSDVASMAQQSHDIASDLEEVVSKFKL